MDEKRCKTCEHWKPVYRGVGECLREGLPNSIFWVERGGSTGRLLTMADFGCFSHAITTDTSKHSL